MSKELIAELTKAKVLFQQRAICAALGIKAEPIQNELPCGCHDHPKYGHVIMAGCELHD